MVVAKVLQWKEGVEFTQRQNLAVDLKLSAWEQFETVEANGIDNRKFKAGVFPFIGVYKVIPNSVLKLVNLGSKAVYDTLKKEGNSHDHHGVYKSTTYKTYDGSFYHNIATYVDAGVPKIAKNIWVLFGEKAKTKVVLYAEINTSVVPPKINYPAGGGPAVLPPPYDPRTGVKSESLPAGTNLFMRGVAAESLAIARFPAFPVFTTIDDLAPSAVPQARFVATYTTTSSLLIYNLDNAEVRQELSEDGRGFTVGAVFAQYAAAAGTYKKTPGGKTTITLFSTRIGSKVKLQGVVDTAPPGTPLPGKYTKNICILLLC